MRALPAGRQTVDVAAGQSGDLGGALRHQPRVEQRIGLRSNDDVDAAGTAKVVNRGVTMLLEGFDQLEKLRRVVTAMSVHRAIAADDAAVYISLPASGRIHLQLTGVSVLEIPAITPTKIPVPVQKLSFAGSKGAPPDSTVWNYDIGG